MPNGATKLRGKSNFARDVQRVPQQTQHETTLPSLEQIYALAANTADDTAGALLIAVP